MFDPTKSYSPCYGSHEKGAKYYQNGRYYDAAGVEIEDMGVDDVALAEIQDDVPRLSMEEMLAKPQDELSVYYLRVMGHNPNPNTPAVTLAREIERFWARLDQATARVPGPDSASAPETDLDIKDNAGGGELLGGDKGKGKKSSAKTDLN